MQNINLYQVEHKRRDGPSPRQMTFGWVVLLVLMLLHAGWQAWQLRQHTAQGAEEGQVFGGAHRLDQPFQKRVHIGSAQGLRVVALQFGGNLGNGFHGAQ